jgi:hypothetical protein
MKCLGLTPAAMGASFCRSRTCDRPPSTRADIANEHADPDAMLPLTLRASTPRARDEPIGGWLVAAWDVKALSASVRKEYPGRDLLLRLKSLPPIPSREE